MRALLTVLRPLTVSGRVRPFSSQHGGWRGEEGERRRTSTFLGLTTGGALLAGGLMAGEVKAKTREETILEVAGERRPGLPEYSMEEVGTHHTEETRVWVTYKNGVYDVTDLIPIHPGADKLMMAAGNKEDFEDHFDTNLNRWQRGAILENIRSSFEQRRRLRGTGEV